MKRIHFRIYDELAEQINEAIIHWGFSSHAEFFRYLAMEFILIEMKLLTRPPTDLNQHIIDLIPTLSNYLEISNFNKMALIIFLRGEVPISFQQVRKYQDGTILATVIKIE